MVKYWKLLLWEQEWSKDVGYQLNILQVILGNVNA